MLQSYVHFFRHFIFSLYLHGALSSWGHQIHSSKLLNQLVVFRHYV